MSVHLSANSTGISHVDPDDLVLYAMQFLTGDEAAVIDGHVQNCAECREELARIQGDLAAYAFTAEVESAPAPARQRLMAQIAKEKKAAPVVQPIARPIVRPIVQPVVQTPLAAFGRNGSILSPVEDELPKRNIGLVILGWTGWAVAAGLAVVAGSLYKGRDSLRDSLANRTGQVQRLTADAVSAHQLMDALTDPAAVRVTLTAKPQPKAVPIGGVTYEPEKGTLVFLASNLEPLQLYKVYELWLIPTEGNAPMPAGTFHPDDKGNASVIMPDLPKGVTAKAFGVTVEDEGGSQTPTLPIVLAGS